MVSAVLLVRPQYFFVFGAPFREGRLGGGAFFFAFLPRSGLFSEETFSVTSGQNVTMGGPGDRASRDSKQGGFFARGACRWVRPFVRGGGPTEIGRHFLGFVASTFKIFNYSQNTTRMGGNGLGGGGSDK